MGDDRRASWRYPLGRVSGFGYDSDDEDELGRTIITTRGEVLERSRAVRAHLLLLTGPEAGRVFPIESHEATLGRSAAATVRLEDDSISRVHCRIVRVGDERIVEDMGSANGTYVNDERITRASLKDGDKVRIGETTVVRYALGDRLDERFQQQMYDAALRDALTGAFNKRYVLDCLAKEVRFAARHRTELCLLMFDIDHFKRVNDTHGHLAGDQVLAQLGQLSLALVRAEDVCARYGGEEFAVVARAISLAQGGLFAERLRAQVEATAFDIGGQTLRLTVSVGVALWQPHMTDPAALVAAADAALYAAKRAGRNQFALSTPL